MRIQIVDGNKPVTGLVVRMTVPDAESVIGRVIEVTSDADGYVTLPMTEEGQSFTVAVPALSDETHTFSVPRGRDAVRWRISPREWQQRAVPESVTNPDAKPGGGGTTTITFTIDCWANAFTSGNNCDFCSGTITPPPFTYSCSEGTGGWTPVCGFPSPVAADSLVTKVEAVVDMKDCSGQRGYSETVYSTTLNGTQIAAPHTLSVNNCGCVGETCLLEDFVSADYSSTGGFPGFVNGGTNVFGFDISTGAICVEKVNITLTYTSNKKLTISNIADPIIPAKSGLVNDCVLYRYSITATASDGATPQSGVKMTFSSDRNAVTAGTDTFNQPNGTDKSGAATGTVETRKRGVANFTAKANGYTDSPAYAKGFIDAAFENPFNITAYKTSLESDFAGAQTTNPCGVTGTFFDDFLDDVRLEGTGKANDGRFIQYAGRQHGNRCYEVVTCPLTKSGVCAQVGTTIAVDPDVMPLGSLVNIANVGLRTAQDTGGAIRNEHIDVYVGLGQAAIDAFTVAGTSQQVTLIGGAGQCQ
jgi:3D (Asp-Asp-Asp) domain-containing protein